MNKLVLSSLLILFTSAVFIPATKAEKEAQDPATETRSEEVQQEVEEDPVKTEDSLENIEDQNESKSETEPQTRSEEVQQEVEEDSVKTEDSLESIEEQSESETETEPQTRSEEVQQEVEEQDSNSSSKTQAFDLVTSAYQGEYEEQGIPGFNQLLNAYNTGELTAEKLVMTAIDNGDLAPKVMNDEKYINAVELQLQALEEN